MKVHKYFRVPPVEGDVGVEIETEGFNLARDVGKYWRAERDGSLRGEDNIEYVLKRPSSLQELKRALAYLNLCLEDEGSEVDMSRRTSTHVHINVCDMSMTHLVNYIVLLLIFEDFLVDWCNPSRKGNLFCLRSSDAEGMILALTAFLRTGQRFNLHDNIRYSAINLASLSKYGSVEIRSLEGTVDSARITEWCEFLLHLREKAKTFNNPTQIIEDMSVMEYLPFVKSILGKHYRTLYKGKGKQARLLEAIRRAQDVAFSYREELFGGHNVENLKVRPVPNEIVLGEEVEEKPYMQMYVAEVVNAVAEEDF